MQNKLTKIWHALSNEWSLEMIFITFDNFRILMTNSSHKVIEPGVINLGLSAQDLSFAHEKS